MDDLLWCSTHIRDTHVEGSAPHILCWDSQSAITRYTSRKWEIMRMPSLPFRYYIIQSVIVLHMWWDIQGLSVESRVAGPAHWTTTHLKTLQFTCLEKWTKASADIRLFTLGLSMTEFQAPLACLANVGTWRHAGVWLNPGANSRCFLAPCSKKINEGKENSWSFTALPLPPPFPLLPPFPLPFPPSLPLPLSFPFPRPGHWAIRKLSQSFAASRPSLCLSPCHPFYSRPLCDWPRPKPKVPDGVCILASLRVHVYIYTHTSAHAHIVYVSLYV